MVGHLKPASMPAQSEERRSCPSALMVLSSTWREESQGQALLRFEGSAAELGGWDLGCLGVSVRPRQLQLVNHMLRERLAQTECG